MTADPWCRAVGERDRLRLALGGRWTAANAAAMGKALDAIPAQGQSAATLDLGAIEALDTLGAWLLLRARARLEAGGTRVALTAAAEAHLRLLDRVGTAAVAPPPPERPHPWRALVERTGRGTIQFGYEARDLLAFVGAVTIALARTVAQPRRLRFTSLVSHLEQVGVNALSILGLLSFLIGIVLAYQSIDQLRWFGAELFTVNLLGISVLREIGPLLTAILVAGRSGSAFTAQIGTMQINEEVDAMRTLGLDPLEVLVLPRLLALVVALPLLTFYAEGMAVLGGAIIAMSEIDLSLTQFLTQFRSAIGMNTLWVGLVKTPVFASLIAVVGCFDGLKVGGSAESVGRLTTAAVVESIFLVIVFDAMFSILFAYLKV